MYSKTIDHLEKFDNQHDFERMSADIMNALGNKDVVLIAPRGGSDGGRDVTFTTESGGKGLACVTLREDIQRKFEEDFSQRKTGEYEKYFLFCTAYLTAEQKRKFAKYCLNNLEAEFVPYDIEALRSLLDSVLTPIRERYLYRNEQEVQQANQEQQHRSTLLKRLKGEYIMAHPNVSDRIIIGTEPLPKEWVEKRLGEMGEIWRQDIYLV